MATDILTRIELEMHDQLALLRGPSDEYRRLQAQLRKLPPSKLPLSCQSPRPRPPSVSPKVLQLIHTRGHLECPRPGRRPRRRAEAR
jgi:hypothetical protein